MAIPREQAHHKLFLDGRLEGIDPPELIHRICLPGRTGTLTFSRGDLCKTVYVNSGRLIFATSNVAEDRLGETLVRSGMIGYREFEEAGGHLGSGKRLGAILVELGSLSPENLVRGVLEQVKDIILDLFTWERGAYRFVEGALPSPEVITLNISTPRIIFEGVHRIHAWPRIAEGVGSPRTIYRLTDDGREIAGELDLGAAEGLILEMLEEPVSVAEICRGVFLPNFEVYQALWAFRILGILREAAQASDVRRVESPPAGDAAPTPASAVRKGRLEDVTLGPLLVRLCRDGETGILYLGRAGEERALHLRSGTVVFATSSRPEDNLTSFLLRGGVIGLRDRDEVERRLLSNKRAGTILREMGILSQDELVRFVRDQLREIILSVFQWEEGEWRFVPGDLPTLEGITLDRPVEEWVLRGVKRVRNWARIRQECGDLGTVLRPVESPSAALGGVDLGAEEGEVLAAVQVPRSVGGICESMRISHYRVCQILWGLQMIGAIVRVPGEAIAAPLEARPALEPFRCEDGTARETRSPHSEWGTASAGEREERPYREVPGRAQALVASPSDELAIEIGPGRSSENDPENPAPDAPRTFELAPMPSCRPPEPGAATATVPDGATAQEPDGPTAAEPDGATATEPDGATATEPDGAAATEPDGAAATEPDGAAATEPDGAAATERLARRDADAAAKSLAAPEESRWPIVRSDLSETNQPEARASVEETAASEPPPQAEDLAGSSVEDDAAPRESVEVTVVMDGEPAQPGDARMAAVSEAAQWQETIAGSFVEDDAAPEPAQLPLPRNEAAGTSTEAAPEPGVSAFGRPMPPGAARRVGMLKEIERFNTYHHEIYAVLKGTLGARAKNTVVNCIKKLDDAVLVFAGLAPDDTGHFQAAELYERLKDHPRADARGRLDSLLLAEGRFLAPFLDRRGGERLELLFSKITQESRAEAKTEMAEPVAAGSETATRPR